MSDDSSSETEYVVEKILNKKGYGKNIQYLIKWKDFGDEDNTWEPVGNLECPELIQKFEDELAKRKGKNKKENPSTPRLSVRANTNTPGKTPNRKRKISSSSSSEPEPTPKKKASKFVQSVILHTSSSDSEQSTTSEKKPEDTDEQQQGSATPESSVSKETQEKPAKTPILIDDYPDLGYNVVEILDMKGKIVVRAEDGSVHVAETKAVAKQKKDMVLDYLISRAK